MNIQHSNTKKLESGCAQLGVALSASQCALLLRHLELLAKWNRRVNLTALQSGHDMIVRHALDCVAIAPFVHGQSLLDIGSGGGFPGVPLAIVMPEIEVTLLDARAKRVEFLRHVCATLALGNVKVVANRVEDYRPAVKFDTLATRAFASLADTLAATVGLHHRGARLLAMKGRMPTQEIAHLTAPMQQQMRVQKLNVPFLAAQRHLIMIDL